MLLQCVTVASVTQVLHYCLNQGLQAMACGPNPAHEAISSGLQRHFFSYEEIKLLRNIC